MADYGDHIITSEPTLHLSEIPDEVNKEDVLLTAQVQQLLQTIWNKGQAATTHQGSPSSGQGLSL